MFIIIVVYYDDSLIVYFITDIMMIVDMKNMIAVQDRDHQIVANTEERITDVKKNIMMNATNIEVNTFLKNREIATEYFVEKKFMLMFH